VDRLLGSETSVEEAAKGGEGGAGRQTEGHEGDSREEMKKP
jgi:hypothetical protein